VFQALLLTLQITAGLTLMNEIQYYDSLSLTGIAFSACMSMAGISVVVFKIKLPAENDDDFKN
jgi:hypothetical protein